MGNLKENYPELFYSEDIEMGSITQITQSEQDLRIGLDDLINALQNDITHLEAVAVQSQVKGLVKQEAECKAMALAIAEITVRLENLLEVRR
jgi:hypothetical protein